MSEKERQLNRQSEPLNLNQGDYKNDEEKVRLAFAKLRLLNHGEEALSLQQAISRSRQLNDTYIRWKESNAPIKGIDVRVSTIEKTSLARIHDMRCGKISFNATLPRNATLYIWKEADEQFDEVLLLSQLLSSVSSDEYCVERAYPNGQTLSLRIEYYPSEEFSISVGVTEPKAREYVASTPRFFNMLTWAWGGRPSYALAMALCIFMVTLGLNVLPSKPGLVEVPKSEQARGFIQKDPLPTLNTLTANTPEYSPSSTNTTKDEIWSQEPIIHGRPYYASSLEDSSARSKYCVVGEFEGRARDNKRIIDVTLSAAKLNLCSYSGYGARRIAIKIGVMNANGIRGGETGNVQWSRSVTLAERLNPGETFSLPNSVGISIPKRGSVDMSNAKFVIQLISTPYDSNRKSYSYLSEVKVA